MSADARWALRATTAAAHTALDAELGRLDLGDPAQYRTLLLAHRYALPELELEVTASGAAWSGWAPRARQLEDDLCALGVEVSAPPPHASESSPARGWGVQYVLEGARLGGALLAARLPPGAPRSYLGGEHRSGAWRAFQAELEAACLAGGEGFLPEAQQAALRAFERFANGVRQAVEAGD